MSRTRRIYILQTGWNNSMYAARTSDW